MVGMNHDLMKCGCGKELWDERYIVVDVKVYGKGSKAESKNKLMWCENCFYKMHREGLFQIICPHCSNPIRTSSSSVVHPSMAAHVVKKEGGEEGDEMQVL